MVASATSACTIILCTIAFRKLYTSRVADRELGDVQMDSMLCFPIYATARAVSRTYSLLLEAAGLTYPQYLVIFVLWQQEEPLSISQIGEQLHLDSGTLTPLVKRLEA